MEVERPLPALGCRAMTKHWAVIGVAALGLGVSACGGTSLSGDKSNDFVEQQINAFVPGGAKVTADCPDVDDAKKGKSYTCPISGAGGKGSVTVHITNVDGDKVTLAITPADIKLQK
jgi:Domain of unknown function (DUF4333)